MRRPSMQSMGERFGALVVTKVMLGSKGKNARAEAKCDCGCVWEGILSDLRRGMTKSCGCLRVDAKTTHGLCDHPLYQVWVGIRARVLDPTHAKYKDYGLRGITIDPDWVDDPSAFITWVGETLGERPSAQHSIDRIENDGPYSKGNLKWSTAKQQCNNRRNSLHITFDGLNLTLSQWSDKLGVAYGTLYSRLRYGWSIERTLTTP